jgi:hypothetical protein
MRRDQTHPSPTINWTTKAHQDRAAITAYVIPGPPVLVTTGPARRGNR